VVDHENLSEEGAPPTEITTFDSIEEGYGDEGDE
jgi:hypothetical protein